MTTLKYILDFRKRHWKFILLILLYLIVSIFLIYFDIRGFPIPDLENTYPTFILSLLAFILILIIGSSLIYRHEKWGKFFNFKYHLYWSFSFFTFSLVFLGLILESLGLTFANSQKPEIFFIFRQGMIFFAFFQWFGIGEIIFSIHPWKKWLQRLPALLIFFISEIFFIFGLLYLKNIEITMYAFLYTIFIPVAFTMAYMWYVLNKRYYLTGYSKRAVFYLIMGFIWFGITYSAWTPWHYPDVRYVYLIWFGLFLISLILMLIGFMMLPYGQSHSTDFPKFPTYEMSINKNPVNRLAEENNEKSTHFQYQKFLEYSSFISHELKNPLITISGFINLAKRLVDNPDDKQKLLYYIEKIEKNNKQSLRLIEDITDLRKLETQTLVMKPESFQFFEQVEEIINTFKQQYKEIKIQTEFPKGISCYLDRARIEQVIWNLLDNAKKYIDPQIGEVALSGDFNTETKLITLTIEDNGPGIPEPILHSLFEKYVSADTVFGHKGSGIGLYLSQLIIRYHGGEILGQNNSRFAHGAKFIVKIPVKTKNFTQFQLLKLF